MTSVHLSDNPEDFSPEAPQKDPGYAPANKYARRLISYFIIYHLFAFMLWNMPTQSRLKTLCLPYIQKYLHFTCIWQLWAMFQQPGLDNIYMSARIKYADGTQKEWYIGRQDNLGPWDALINERSRKMMEYAFNKTQTKLYPNMANWAAWRNFKDPNNPPVSVQILRYWYPIEKPSIKLTQSPITPIPQWYSDIVYTGKVNVRNGKISNSEIKTNNEIKAKTGIKTTNEIKAKTGIRTTNEIKTINGIRTMEKEIDIQNRKPPPR